MVQPSEIENSEEVTSCTTSNKDKQDRDESSNSTAFRIKNVSEINATSTSEVDTTNVPSSSKTRKRQYSQVISSPQATETRKAKQTSADECTSSSAPDEDRLGTSEVNGVDILEETVHSDIDEIEIATLKIEAEDKDEETGEVERLVDPLENSTEEANVKSEPETNETEEEEGDRPTVAGIVQEATSTSRKPTRCYRRNAQYRIKKSNVNSQAQVHSNVPTLSNLNFDVHDPGKWPDLNDKVVQFIVEKGPKEVSDIKFPLTNGRKFNLNNYTRILANGQTVKRMWVIYSISMDVIFCFCCKLFSKNKESSQLSSSGSKNWTHSARVLRHHERTAAHMKCFKIWKELELKLSKDSSSDSQLDNISYKEVEYWRQVLKRILICIKFLAVQSLPLRGSSDVLHTTNNGNFLKLIEAISNFDPFLSEHMRRIVNTETQSKYLGTDIQNELIEIITNVVKSKIVSYIKKAKYYSIIVDCIPDQSRTKHLSLIIRIVHSTNNGLEVKEFFVGFLTTSDTTCKSLTDLVLDQLNRLTLSIEDCRGQGYDYGSNKKAKELGMQSRIRSLESRAVFVPCASHSLNLILVDSVQCCSIAVNFFDIVQSLYTFFSVSTNRWDIWKKHVKALTLKPFCTTRWESRIDALKPLLNNLDDVYEALVELSEDKDCVTRYTAECLGNKIMQFEFVCCLLIWHDILSRSYIVSEYFQNPNACLIIAADMLKSTKAFLIDLRTEHIFEEYLQKAREIAMNLDIPDSFPPPSTLRPRREATRVTHERTDEALSDPINKFKIDFYFKVLDEAIASVSERFEQLQKYNISFEFLYDLASLASKSEQFIERKCKILECSLGNQSKADINGAELFEELKMFSTFNVDLSTIDCLNYIFRSKLETVFPNLVIALRILLTIPVTVASGEPSLTKLKMIKKYLNSTIEQDRLVDLSLLAIESDLIEDIDYNGLLNEFAKRKACA